MALSKIEGSSLDIGQIGGRRNLIINGAMQVAQRSTNTVAVSDGSNEGVTTVDRWNINFGSGMGGAANASQSNAPSGSEFSKALKFEVTTAHTPTGSQFFNPTYAIEGQDLQHLQYGTSSAKSMVISFSIYTNKPGTYGVAVRSYDYNRVIGKTFTVDTANTWQRISIPIEGDVSGTIDNDNHWGLHLWFGFGIGSGRMNGTSTWSNYNTTVYPGSSTTNFFDTVGNILYLTGVQLEVGSVATPFEHRSYGEELALCQRYLCAVEPYSWVVQGDGSNTGVIIGLYKFPVTMRATPSCNSFTLGHVNGGWNHTRTVQNADPTGLQKVSYTLGLLPSHQMGWNNDTIYADAEL